MSNVNNAIKKKNEAVTIRAKNNVQGHGRTR